MGVTGGVRAHAPPTRSRSFALPPSLSQNSAPQTAEPDGATADSGPSLRHRGPRSEHARSRRALAWASPSPSEAVDFFEAPHSHESAPQTAEPDGATADSGLSLRHRGPRSEHARSRRALAWASPSPSEAVDFFEAPHSHEPAPQTAEPDGATADSGPSLRHRGPRSEHVRSRRALAWASPSP